MILLLFIAIKSAIRGCKEEDEREDGGRCNARIPSSAPRFAAK